MICECGHGRDKHYNVPTIVGCSADSSDPKFFCPCCNFIPDNLKYLEMKAMGEI